VIKLIQDEFGAKQLVAVFAKTDGWSRFQHMEKMAGTALRGLFFDGSMIERFVSMRLYEDSTENAMTLADGLGFTFHRFNVERFLKVILTDSPSVTLSAIELLNLVREAKGLPRTVHGLCNEHKINNIFVVVERTLRTTCPEWRCLMPVVKMLRNPKVKAALRALGSRKTTVRLPPGHAGHTSLTLQTTWSRSGMPSRHHAVVRIIETESALAATLREQMAGFTPPIVDAAGFRM
jgi:hypothetical protein